LNIVYRVFISGNSVEKFGTIIFSTSTCVPVLCYTILCYVTLVVWVE